jgi:predicted NBD/HSP70 family sugar kinase
MDFYLGIDIGTSRVKAVLFDERFQACASAAQNTGPRLSANGHAEQDMAQLWQSVVAILRDMPGIRRCKAGVYAPSALPGRAKGSGSATPKANRSGRVSCGATPAAAS